MAKKIAPEGTKKAAKQPAAEERGPTIEDRFAEFSARYKWYIFVPLGLIVIAVIMFAVLTARANARERAATAALRTAQTPADYEAVATQHPGTFSGRLALVRAGDQLFREGKYAEARAQYEAFLSKKGSCGRSYNKQVEEVLAY